MSDWQIYRGDNKPRRPHIPIAPPWRRFDVEAESAPPPKAVDPKEKATFQASPEVVDAVNAALRLRRPLLLTGDPGSGKSSLIDAVARELDLGRVLRWHVTSRSTLNEALYRYDAIGRMQAEHFERGTAIGDFLRLGPLGTALVPRDRPRALLVDEIDKSDIDLPNDLLNIFERGEFEIPELSRHPGETVDIREHESDLWVPIRKGNVRCREFPFVVLTSNGERDFPPAFLRRCIRLRMPTAGIDLLTEIVTAHLGKKKAAAATELISDFEGNQKRKATDQLLNAAYLVTNNVLPDDPAKRQEILDTLLKELTSDTA
jgi:MoxR-like ATPase